MIFLKKSIDFIFQMACSPRFNGSTGLAKIISNACQKMPFMLLIPQVQFMMNIIRM